MGVVLVKKHKTFFFSLKDVSVNYKYTKPHTESEDAQKLLMGANRSKGMNDESFHSFLPYYKEGLVMLGTVKGLP